MQGKKGLMVTALVLVAVVGIAALAYNALGAQGPSVPKLAPSSAAEAASSSAEGASSDGLALEGAQDSSGDRVALDGRTGEGTASGSAGAGEGQGSSSAAEAGPIKLDDFPIVDLDGNPYRLSDFYGKPTLLGFWATWCPPCNDEAPELQKLYESYGDRVNFVMVDAASDGRDSPSIVRDWLAEGNYSYPVYIDLTGQASSECQIYYLPTMIVLNSKGEVLTGFSGALDEESGSELIEQLLALEAA